MTAAPIVTRTHERHAQRQLGPVISREGGLQIHFGFGSERVAAMQGALFVGQHQLRGDYNRGEHADSCNPPKT